MQRSSTRPVFSPSDLNHFLECEHLIQLELRGDAAPRQERDAHAELLAAKGLEHERAWLQRFRDQGLRIVEIDSDGERNWERDAGRTIAAMREGVDVIYQGVFLDDGWRGISDFLIRTDIDATPSISPDGKTVVFVSGRTSVASFFVTTVDGAEPRQLTNIGLESHMLYGGAPASSQYASSRVCPGTSRS